MASSSPEVEVGAPQTHGHGVNGRDNFIQGSSSLAELSAIFPDLDVEVLSGVLRAQAGSVEAVVEYLLSGNSLTEVGQHQQMEDPLIEMVGKFSHKIGGLPEVVPAVSSEFQVNEEEQKNSIQDQLMCGNIKIRSEDLIVADGVLPLRAIEDRQALLKETEEIVKPVLSEEPVLRQPSNYSFEGRIGYTEEVNDESSTSDSDAKESVDEVAPREEEDGGGVLQKKKNKKRYNFLSRKGAAKHRGSQDSTTGSSITSHDLRPLIDDDDLQDEDEP